MFYISLLRYKFFFWHKMILNNDFKQFKYYLRVYNKEFDLEWERKTYNRNLLPTGYISDNGILSQNNHIVLVYKCERAVFTLMVALVLVYCCEMTLFLFMVSWPLYIAVKWPVTCIWHEVTVFRTKKNLEVMQLPINGGWN